MGDWMADGRTSKENLTPMVTLVHLYNHWVETGTYIDLALIFLPKDLWQQRPIATIWLTILFFVVSPPFWQRKKWVSTPTLHDNTRQPMRKNPKWHASTASRKRHWRWRTAWGFGSRGLAWGTSQGGELDMKPWWWKPSYHGNPKPSLIWGYNPYFGVCKTFIFHGFGVQGYFLLNSACLIPGSLFHGLWNNPYYINLDSIFPHDTEKNNQGFFRCSHGTPWKKRAPFQKESLFEPQFFWWKMLVAGRKLLFSQIMVARPQILL